MSQYPFGRKVALPHTRRESNDSTDAVMSYGWKKGQRVPTGLDRTVAVSVQCSLPKSSAIVYGYLVCPVGWKTNGNLNTYDTMAYVIMDTDGQIGTVRLMEQMTGFSETTNDWGKNILVRVREKQPNDSGLLRAKDWAAQFIAATPEERARAHNCREQADRHRRAAVESGTQLDASNSSSFADATAAVISRVQCTADVRLAFQECVTTFADAAMQFYDGCAGLDSDPKDSECFAPIMRPVKECLAKFNMRCAAPPCPQQKQGSFRALLLMSQVNQTDTPAVVLSSAQDGQTHPRAHAHFFTLSPQGMSRRVCHAARFLSRRVLHIVKWQPPSTKRARVQRYTRPPHRLSPAPARIHMLTYLFDAEHTSSEFRSGPRKHKVEACQLAHTPTLLRLRHPASSHMTAAARSAAAVAAVLCFAVLGAVFTAHDAHAPAAARRLLQDAPPASVGRCTLTR